MKRIYAIFLLLLSFSHTIQAAMTDEMLESDKNLFWNTLVVKRFFHEPTEPPEVSAHQIMNNKEELGDKEEAAAHDRYLEVARKCALDFDTDIDEWLDNVMSSYSEALFGAFEALRSSIHVVEVDVRGDGIVRLRTPPRVTSGDPAGTPMTEKSTTTRTSVIDELGRMDQALVSMVRKDNPGLKRTIDILALAKQQMAIDEARAILRQNEERLARDAKRRREAAEANMAGRMSVVAEVDSPGSTPGRRPAARNSKEGDVADRGSKEEDALAASSTPPRNQVHRYDGTGAGITAASPARDGEDPVRKPLVRKAAPGDLQLANPAAGGMSPQVDSKKVKKPKGNKEKGSCCTIM